MLRYDIVDVFADQPFAGNPLAVVHGAEALNGGQMLALTREFSLSETTFPSEIGPDGYAVRIFTPGGEIPFAGHPTLGTAWVLRRSGAFAGDAVTQRCTAGDIAVRFYDSLVELTAPPGDLVPCHESVVASVLTGLGLADSDLAGPAYFGGTGLTFLHVPVHDYAVERAGPAHVPTAPPEVRDPLGGINVYAVDGTDVHARMFAPDLAVAEDPATGSAAAGLGLVLVARGLVHDGGTYRISQGTEMGRPSTLFGSVAVSDGVATSVSVAGQVHPVASGEIVVPGSF